MLAFNKKKDAENSFRILKKTFIEKWFSNRSLFVPDRIGLRLLSNRSCFRPYLES